MANMRIHLSRKNLPRTLRGSDPRHSWPAHGNHIVPIKPCFGKTSSMTLRVVVLENKSAWMVLATADTGAVGYLESLCVVHHAHADKFEPSLAHA